MFVGGEFGVFWLLCVINLINFVIGNETTSRPYEFSFNIVDFQHRYEKKDTDGIITGEFGFITADGVYHETGYATDKNGDFIITRMRNRRITSLKDAQEIFKDKPEVAKKLAEAVARACSDCKIAINTDESNNNIQTTSKTTTFVPEAKRDPIFRNIIQNLAENQKDESFEKRNEIPENSKNLSNERRGNGLPGGIIETTTKQETVYQNSRKKIVNEEKMGNDLYYRFNYTITSHDHQEDGYKSGKKDGSYRAQNENGVDTRVKYLSNEFGHQPNVSFVPRDAINENQRLQGYSFLWYWS